jgi:ribosomal protein L40E
MQTLADNAQLAAPPIRVENDPEGVRIALVELFEESFFLMGEDDLGGDTESLARLRDNLPPRTLSPGYYDHARYLLELGYSMEAGVQYTADTLSRTDVRGLQALARAHATFNAKHPSCSRCGARQDSDFAPNCRKCGVEFVRRAN